MDDLVDKRKLLVWLDSQKRISAATSNHHGDVSAGMDAMANITRMALMSGEFDSNPVFCKNCQANLTSKWCTRVEGVGSFCDSLCMDVWGKCNG
jgi:hypothetical protein